jgi:hypothetical protein
MNHSFSYKSLILLLTFCAALGLTSFVSAQSGTAELGVFESYKVAPGSVIQIPVAIRNVKDLYAVDFTLKYDPALLQVVDADLNIDGIQSSLGDFLDPGLLLYNLADNTAGTIRFVMSQYNPSEAKSGKGNILIISFKGLAEGESPLEISSVTLSTREGVSIPCNGYNSTLSINATAPTQASTMVVVQPTGLIVVHTLTPTLTATITPLPSATPTPGITIVDNEPTKEITRLDEDHDNSGYFLVENWWILLILLVIVISIILYLFVIRKYLNKKKGEN